MQIRLATRFTATIAGILMLSIVSSLVALYAAWRVNRRLEQAHQEELPSVRAEEVEILLLERNSLVAAQLLDKDNPVWTKNLARSQGQFQQWIAKVRSSTVVPADEEELLRRLEEKWAGLDAAQQKAIELHGQGKTEKAKTLLLTEIRDHLSKDAYDLCEQLIASNDRYVKQIIRRFLEFARPMELQCRPLEVNCVVQQTLDLFEQQLKDRNIRVAKTSTAKLPAVSADTGKLKQVFINRIGNAVDAMPQGGEIQIGTTAENDAAGRRMVVVRVRDRGHGMPKAVQERIFDPFFTTKEDGTGLGLCIAAQIMTHHEGSLVLESSTEHGTTFAVWLPALREHTRG